MNIIGLILFDRFGVRTQFEPVRKKMGQPELRTELRFGSAVRGSNSVPNRTTATL
jgi:hypothetical protein